MGSILKDINGIIFKVEDKVEMEIKGLGKGEVSIVELNKELYIFDEQNGLLNLKEALKRNDITLKIITKCIN